MREIRHSSSDAPPTLSVETHIPTSSPLNHDDTPSSTTASPTTGTGQTAHMSMTTSTSTTTSSERSTSSMTASSSSSSSLTSSSHSHKPAAQLSVTFAPLPQLEPRKRRSPVPLGMAARSQLMARRRRAMYGTGAGIAGGPDGMIVGPDAGGDGAPRYSNPMWTEQEMAEHRKRFVEAELQQQERVRRDGLRSDADGGGEDEAGRGEPDPFVVLGKMVKVASRNIWRRVSHGKDKTDKGHAGAGVEGEEEQTGEADPVQPVVSSIELDGETAPAQSVPADAIANDGGPESAPDLKSNDDGSYHRVSSEHHEGAAHPMRQCDEGDRHRVKVSLPPDVGETETILEGRPKYARLEPKSDEVRLLEDKGAVVAQAARPPKKKPSLLSKSSKSMTDGSRRRLVSR